MVSSLSGNSAQNAILTQLIASLQGGAANLPLTFNEPKEKCLSNRESLIDRVSNSNFHGIDFQQGMLVASIRPTSSPGDLPLFDPTNEDLLRLGLRPFGAQGWGDSKFGDRIVASTDYLKKNHEAVTELLADGTINAAGHDILAIKPEFWQFMNKKPPENLIGIPSIAFEKQLIEAIASYLKCLKALGTTGPWWIALGLINVKRSILYVSEHLMFSGRAFEGDNMLLPIVAIPTDVDLDDNQSVARGLRPAFDYLWREHNYPRSLSFSETGDWIGG